MARKTVTVKTTITVNYDESKFTGEFREKFSKLMFPADVEERIKLLAELFACGIVKKNNILPGYGNLAKIGITFEKHLTESKIHSVAIPRSIEYIENGC